MQVVCNQCGKAIAVQLSPGPTHATCSRCGARTAAPSVDDFEPRPTQPARKSVLIELEDSDDGFAGQARNAMDRQMRVLCGACRRGLWVGVRMAGKQVRCPACKAVIRIPATEEGTLEPAPEAGHPIADRHLAEEVPPENQDEPTDGMGDVQNLPRNVNPLTDDSEHQPIQPPQAESSSEESHEPEMILSAQPASHPAKRFGPKARCVATAVILLITTGIVMFVLYRFHRIRDGNDDRPTPALTEPSTLPGD